MDDKFQPSFIPKKAPIINYARKKVGGNFNIFTFLSIIILILTVAASVAVFLFVEIEKKSIASKIASLERWELTSDNVLIEKLAKTDKRIKTANALLDRHVSPSVLFGAIGSKTVKSVRYLDFNYSLSADNKVKLSMKGQGRNFNSVAAQSDIISQDNESNFKEPVFSGVSLDNALDVRFDFVTNLEADLILYKENLGQYASLSDEQGMEEGVNGSNPNL